MGRKLVHESRSEREKERGRKREGMVGDLVSIGSGDEAVLCASGTK